MPSLSFSLYTKILISLLTTILHMHIDHTCNNNPNHIIHGRKEINFRACKHFRTIFSIYNLHILSLTPPPPLPHSHFNNIKSSTLILKIFPRPPYLTKCLLHRRFWYHKDSFMTIFLTTYFSGKNPISYGTQCKSIKNINNDISNVKESGEGSWNIIKYR